MVFTWNEQIKFLQEFMWNSGELNLHLEKISWSSCSLNIRKITSILYKAWFTGMDQFRNCMAFWDCYCSWHSWLVKTYFTNTLQWWNFVLSSGMVQTMWTILVWVYNTIHTTIRYVLTTSWGIVRWHMVKQQFLIIYKIYISTI